MQNPKEDPKPAIRILLIDLNLETEALIQSYIRKIEHARFHLDSTTDLGCAAESIRENRHDIYLLHFSPAGTKHLDFLKAVRKEGSKNLILTLLDTADEKAERLLMEAGANDILVQDQFDSSDLDRTIRYALLQRKSEAQLERLIQERTLELAFANQTLLLADKRKNEFLASLAHELRNPLTPIQNALEVIQNSSQQPGQVEKARGIIERQLQDLIRLIDDFLVISRITRNKLTLQSEQLDLADVLNHSLETNQPLIDKAHLKIEKNFQEGDCFVYGDRMRLEQIFGNLLNNAIKFNRPHGKITLSVKAEKKQYVTRIADTGIGIPRLELQALLASTRSEAFKPNHTSNGLGLGLTLVKKLVEMHGGSVSIQSAGKDQGTEAIVRLPKWTRCEESSASSKSATKGAL
ncbi:hybrid sensor histidine kinase/response regulator [Telmatocola sphagniphila]|uniref:histidine kinase n=1 Tax=Telmatocola sphagniphila TaxID=1123043 RepID=A0A8E6B3Z8_9BACT|nr:HAMP domain-containing sensor histidine kinase [Telmatocola sphagniphila]QVL29945.1 hybrid sensor histidine kinase/response regulator [Telmatocola sphagniphila]